MGKRRGGLGAHSMTCNNATERQNSFECDVRHIVNRQDSLKPNRIRAFMQDGARDRDQV